MGIRRAGPAAASESGDGPGAPAGAQVFDLMRPTDRERVGVFLAEALAAPEPCGPVDLRLRGRDGAWRKVRVHLDNPAVGPPPAPRHDVLDAQRAIAAAVSSEERTRALLENVSDAVVVLDREFRVTYASPALEQILRAPLHTNIGESAFNDIHPADLERVRAVAESLLAEPGGTRRFEMRLRHWPDRDDRWRWLDVVATNRLDDPLVEGVVCVLRDVSEMKAAESRFRDLVEHAPDALVVVDEEGRIELVNGRVESVLGYRPEELLGQPVEVLVPPSVRAEHESQRRAYLQSPSAREMGRGRELVARCADGGELPVAIKLSPVRSADRFLVAASIRDVSDQRAADRLKDEFLATVSHELRTPLTSIVGFAEVLRGDLPAATERRDELLGRVAANALEMVGMVDQMLDYSRLEAGRVSLEPAASQLSEVLGRARSAFERLAGHEVVVAVPDGLAVWADPDAVATVLRNLLTNAAKFAPAGTRVTVSAAATAEGVEVRVTDEGPGIPRADHERIFERFRQLGAPSVGARGTGLGLSIARRYVEAQGGRIWVESQPGAGASFVFTLPAPPVEG